MCIRSLGAIPILIDLLRGSHLEVSHAAAGVLRNLCYGRANDDNKVRCFVTRIVPNVMLSVVCSLLCVLKEDFLL